ncbi:hypothetical protein [Silvibacterium sp.]|uniref:hypothetical protein n=1 Tax=Silvibacterium sp. TaxID=1964179 RepID=UPI0039E29982
MYRRRQLALALAALSLSSLCLAQDTATAEPGKTAAPRHAPTEHDRAEAEKHYLAGAKAIDRKDLPRAEAEFAHALALDPGNQRYLGAHEIAVQSQVTQLIQAAEKAKILNRLDEANADIREAFRLDPRNPMLVQHLDDITRAAAPDPVQLYPEDTTLAPPVEFAPSDRKQSFHVRTTGQALIRQVLTAYGITPTFDASVKNQPVRFDVDDVNFEQARRMVNLVTNTFITPLDPHRALVAADTKDNRAQYERLVLENIYFPGFDQTETKDMETLAKQIFDAQQVTLVPGSSAITVRAPASRMAALNRTFTELLEGRSEVVLDVRLYQISKTRTTNVGIEAPTQTTVFNIPTQLNSVLSNNSSLVQEIISSGLASAGDYAAIAAILIASGEVTSSVLSQPFAYFGGGETLTGISPGTLTGNLALNSSDTRILDHVQIHAEDREDATLKSGTRYPIITSSYSNLAGSTTSIAGISTAGLSSTLASLGLSAASLTSAAQTIPQVQYEDLGLTLKVKPNIQKDSEVTLGIDFTITSLNGATLNDIPVLDNQEYKAITTLKPGATAMVASTMSRQQSAAVTGIPGLSELPGMGGGTNQDREVDVSNLIILMTPHIVRMAHREEAGKMIFLPVHD